MRRIICPASMSKDKTERRNFLNRCLELRPGESPCDGCKVGKDCKKNYRKLATGEFMEIAAMSIKSFEIG